MVIEHHYAEWCRRNGKRRSQAGWETWKGGYEWALQEEVPGFDSLSAQQKEMVTSMIRLLAEGAPYDGP